MGKRDYVQQRAAIRLAGDGQTRDGVKALLEARREALALRELCQAHQADGTADDRQSLEETAQTLGALARELDHALQAAREAQRIWDQLSTVEARLATTLGPPSTSEPTP